MERQNTQTPVLNITPAPAPKLKLPVSSVILSLLAFVLLSLTVYLAYQNRVLRGEISELKSFTPQSDTVWCGGWDTSGEIVCSCKGNLISPACPPGRVCDSGDYFCQGECGSCCYKGAFENPNYPECN